MFFKNCRYLTIPSRWPIAPARAILKENNRTVVHVMTHSYTNQIGGWTILTQPWVDLIQEGNFLSAEEEMTFGLTVAMQTAPSVTMLRRFEYQ